MRHVKNKRVSAKERFYSKMELEWFSRTQTIVVIVADIFHVVRGREGRPWRRGGGGGGVCVEGRVGDGGCQSK